MSKITSDAKKSEKQKAEKPVDKAAGVSSAATAVAVTSEQAETAAVVAEPGKKAAKKPAKQAPKPASQSAEAAAVKSKKENPKSKTEVRAEPKEKAKKTKLVRDSFTMPEAEYKALQDVKRDFLKAGIEVKKSELLRIGVALVKQTDRAKLQEVLASLPSLKAGRPKIERSPE